MKMLYKAYNQENIPIEEFAGITLEELYRIENTFETKVCVYKLVKSDEAEDGMSTAEHFSFIQDVRMYCHSYRCRKCGDSLWKDAYRLRSHERTRTGGVRRVYPGGVYDYTPSVFERLDDENIRVSESLRYYPYRTTFDFECWFDTARLPLDSDKVQFMARHVPLSVSVASNVPGYEQAKCLVTDGDTNKLVSAMMDILRSMSDAAYDKIKDSYEDVLGDLAEDELGRTGARCTITLRRRGISTTDQSIQNADETTLWKDA